MRTHALSRPLVFAAACFTMASSAFAAETSGAFRNFFYTSDGTSVTITGHANIGTSSVDVPPTIDGLPVRTIASLNLPNTTIVPQIVRINVASVTIPDSVTTIGPGVFSYFSALTSVTIPNSVTSMGAGVFTGCTSLTSATLGNGLTTLDGTFISCSKLVTVDLPDQLTSMNLVFGGCSALTTVEIPATVTSLTGAFKGCTKLTSVALPAGVTATGNETFMGCTSLQSATLPDGMVSIGDYAFYNCSSLESVNLPSALTTIGDYAFYNCPGLTSVVFPPALISIGGAAFQGCTGLTSLVVPNTVTIIGDNAFWACVNLTQFVLPRHFLASIANIGLDYKPDLATKALVTGLASELTSSPAFVSALADAILAKSGNYGISTKADITNVVNQTPQTVREVIAEMGSELPVAHGITSDLGTLTVKKGKEVQYAVSTSFTATSFAASGLPDGVTIHPTTGMITGKARKVGVYHAFLHAGVTGGGVVSAVKVFIVTP